jgi:hypothetical protein
MNGRTNAVVECLQFVAGPLIWAAHFFAMYVAAALYCSSTSAGNGAPFLTFAMLWTAITVAALLGLIAGQLTKAGRRAPDADENDGSRFLQRGSIVLGAAALLAVVWSAVPTTMLAACSGVVA